MHPSSLTRRISTGWHIFISKECT